MKTMKQSYFVDKPTLKGRESLFKAKQLISKIITSCITICPLSSLCEFIAKVNTTEKHLLLNLGWLSCTCRPLVWIDQITYKNEHFNIFGLNVVILGKQVKYLLPNKSRTICKMKTIPACFHCGASQNLGHSAIVPLILIRCLKRCLLV